MKTPATIDVNNVMMIVETVKADAQPVIGAATDAM